MSVLIQFVKLGLAIFGLAVGLYLRSPLFASTRSGLVWVILIISISLIVAELIRLQQKQKRLKFLSFMILAIAVAGFVTTAGSELQFNLQKRAVLTANPAQLERLGQHFVIGYRDLNEVKTLVEKRAIAGIFITRRNIENRTIDAIKQEISTLQAVRSQQNLPPLWVATDQEGGIVSRLSPPLTQLPALSSIVQSGNPNQIEQSVTEYAKVHGEELANLGINLNFAPVVDLNQGIINPQDKFSQIYRRAISSDPEVVSAVATQYCQTLESYQVECTIKHFPGLGRLETDTHLAEAELHTSIDELAQADWLPFQAVLRQSTAALMLSHAKLMAIDPQFPVSFSQKVIQSIIRDRWQHDGILITDDFSMNAVFSSQFGVKGGAIAALNAGVDLILISYDKDLYYEAMSALLKADAGDRLDQTLLQNSSLRLQKAHHQAN
jgi:beta-N-acetylhexosaminidase